MSMRRTFIGSTLLLFAALLLAPTQVFAEQVIRTYSSHIEIIADGSANVQEEIVYDFGEERHHGIFRVIPLSVRGLGKTEYASLDISSILVTDGHGNRIDTKYEKGGNSITLTIGDPDTLVFGPQLYVIRYTLWGAVTANLISDQFDWDALGTDWQPGIERARAEIVFPKDVATQKISSRCGFIGDEGKLVECDASAITGTTTPFGYMLRYEATGTPPHTSMMIQAVFPKGAIAYSGKANKGGSSRTAPQGGGVVRWWNGPLFDFSLIIPIIIFIALLSARLNHNVNKKRRVTVTKRQYLLSAGALLVLSFFVPLYNLALLLSAITITLFALIERSGDKD